MNCYVNLQTSNPQNGGQVESWRSGTHLFRWTLCMSGRKSGHSWRTQPSMAYAPVLLLLLSLCLFSTTLHLQPDMNLLTEPAIMSLQIKWHTSIDVIQQTRVPSDVHNCNLNYKHTFQGFSNKRETQNKAKQNMTERCTIDSQADWST